MSNSNNNPRHVFLPSHHSLSRVTMRPNLSWSTIREETSSDILSSELDENRDRYNRLKKLERLKERRYADYQTMKRRGRSKEYQDRFQRDCEEFNNLRYEKIYHKPSTTTFAGKHRSVSVSDVSNSRLGSSRHGYTSLRADDGQTLSPTGSISSIVTLDDDYMYGSRYSSEDLWRSRSRTSSFSTSMARDRLGYFGLRSHEQDDNLFDDASSEYSFSSYVPQRRAFSSCVTPRRYAGIMTPTNDNAEVMATYERMNQLTERLQSLQNERLQSERRLSVDDHSASQTRSRLSSSEHTDSATTTVHHNRFDQTSQTNILPQSPTDHSIPPWSQRVSLLLSSRQHEAPHLSPNTDYSSSHLGTTSSYATNISRNSSLNVDFNPSSEQSSVQSFHSLDQSNLQDIDYSSPTLKSNILSRSFIHHRPESASTPLTMSASEMRQGRPTVNPLSPLSLTADRTHFGSTATGTSQSYNDSHQFQTSYTNILHKTRVTGANQNTSLEQPTTEHPNRLFRNDQNRFFDHDMNENFDRTTKNTHYNMGLSLSPVSPESSQDRHFGINENRSILIRHGRQRSQSSSQDEGIDSGVESASDVGRVSNSVSTDSISKFTVSASKPSESRGRAKFEVSPEPTSQGEKNFEPSFENLTHLSKTEFHQTNSVEADKTIPSVASVISHKEKNIEEPSATKIASMNIEMRVSQPNVGDVSHLPENKVQEVDQIKKNPSATATLSMLTQRQKELTEIPSAQLELKKGTPEIQSGQRQPGDNIYNFSEFVKLNIDKKTFGSDFKDSAELDIQEDNSSVPYRENLETRRIKNVTTTTTTVVGTIMGTEEPVPRINVQSFKSVDPIKDATSQVTVTTNTLSTVTVPSSDRKTEITQIQPKRPDEKNTNDVTKGFSLIKEERTDVSRIISEKPEAAKVLVPISIKEPSPGGTQEDGSSGLMESAVSQNQHVPEVNVIMPKKKKSKKKKSLKDEDKNGIESISKTEEISISTVESSVDIQPNFSGLELSIPGQPANGSDNLIKAPTSQEENVSTATQQSFIETVTSEVEFVSDIYQNGTKNSTGKSVNVSNVDLPSKPHLNTKQPGKEQIEKDIFSAVSTNVSLEKGDKKDNKIVNVQRENQSAKSSAKTSLTKPSKDISSEELQTSINGTANVTIVGTEQLIDSTRKTVEQLQAGDPNCLETGTREKTPTQVSTKLTTTSYQMITSVDNVNIQEPFMSSTKMPSDLSIGPEESIQRKEITETEYSLQDSPVIAASLENNESLPTMKTKEKGKKKKKNSSKTHIKGKNEEQPESLLKETVSPRKLDFVSPTFQDQQKDTLVESVLQTGLPEKVVITSTTETAISKTSETPEEYSVKTVSAELPQQIEFNQHNLADKSAPRIRTVDGKMVPGIPDESAEYKIKSLSEELPGQQVELGKDGELVRKITMTKTTSYEVEPGMLTGPDGDNIHLKNEKSPGKYEDSKLVISQEQGDMFNKVTTTTTTKTFAYKTAEIPEEYSFHKISAELPGQVMAPQQMGFQQDNMVEKVKTITKIPDSKMAPEISNKSEGYHVQSASAEFPGQIKSATQGNLGNKAVPINKMADSKMALGMSDELAEHQIKSVSEEFLGQWDDTRKDEGATDVTTITKTTSYKVESTLGQGTELTPKDFPKLKHNDQVDNSDLEQPESSGGATQTSFFSRVTSTLKNTFSKSSPEVSEKSEFTSPSIADISADSSSVDPIQSRRDATSKDTNLVISSGISAPSIKTHTQMMSPNVSNMPFDSEQVMFGDKTIDPRTAEFVKDSVVTKSIEEKRIVGTVPTVMNTTSYEVSEQTRKEQGEIRRTVEQGDITPKGITTPGTTGILTCKISDAEMDYTVPSVSVKPSDQIKDHELTDIAQGNITDKNATIHNAVTYKTSEKPENYNSDFVSVKLPEQMLEFDKDGETITKVTTTTKTTLYERKPEDIKDSENYYNTQTIIVSSPRKIQDYQPTKLTQKADTKIIPRTLNRTDENQAPSLTERLSEVPEGKDITPKSTTTITKTSTYKTPSGQESYYISSNLDELGQVEGPQPNEIIQGNTLNKITTKVNPVAYKFPDQTESNNRASMSINIPEQKTKFENGETVNKEIATTKTLYSEVDPEMASGAVELNIQPATKKFPGMDQDCKLSGSLEQKDVMGKEITPKTYKTTEILDEYSLKKDSAELPSQKVQQQIEFTQGGMVDNVKTTSKTTDNKMSPETSYKLEEFKIQSVSAEIPGQIILPKQTEFTQDYLAKKLSPTKNIPDSKMFPGMSERPEEYKVKTFSAEFPGQIKSPTQTEFTQGYLADKAAPTKNMPGSKIFPGMSEKPEEYKVQSMSAEFPGQVKSPTQTEFTQGYLADKSAPTINIPGSKMFPGMSERPEEYKVQSISAEFPGQVKSPTQTEFTQGYLADKAAPTINIPGSKMFPGMSEKPEVYKVQSISAEFPGEVKSPTQNEFTQGYLADPVVTSSIPTGHKIDPEIFDTAVEIKAPSLFGKFPDQISTTLVPGNEDQVSLSSEMINATETTVENLSPENSSLNNEEQIMSPEIPQQGVMFSKDVITSPTVVYKNDQDVTEKPVELKTETVTVSIPEKHEIITDNVPDPKQKEETLVESPKQKSKPQSKATAALKRSFKKKPENSTESKPELVPKDKQKKEKPGFLDKIKSTFSKKSGDTTKPEEFPEQGKDSPSAGQNAANLSNTDKSVSGSGTISPKTKTKPQKPLENIVKTNKDLNSEKDDLSTNTNDAAKSMNERRQQIGFTQDNIVGKEKTVTKTLGSKMAPGMSDKPEEYHIQSVSAEFPGQVKSPTETELTQGYLADKIVTTTLSVGQKTVPGITDMMEEPKVLSMSEEFPELVESPKLDYPTTPTSQITYKTILERGIKLPENIHPVSTEQTNLSPNSKKSELDFSPTVSGGIPDVKSISLETSHITFKEPVTIDKTGTKPMTMDMTDFSAHLPTEEFVELGRIPVQRPETTLSPYNTSISSEPQENLKSSQTTLSSEFFTKPTELPTMTQQKSWSDIVKNGKTVDAERIHPNIPSPLSIDKVERPGDGSPHLQQTETEGRTMSGRPEAFVSTSPKLLEHADVLMEDAIAPLQSKPFPSNRPLLRKLSGHDFDVTDFQKTSKPSLKLVAPDCTLLQTKFETDGWAPKVKSPTVTTTMANMTVVQTEFISQSPNDEIKTQFTISEDFTIPAPVPPKRRSREFQSMSEESTDSELPSPTTTTVDFKTLPMPLQSQRPQAPKRKHRKNRKSANGSSSSMSPDPLESKNLDISLNPDGSRPVSQPEFRVPDPDPDVFNETSPRPLSPPNNEIRQYLMVQSSPSLNKSPHTSSVVSDSLDFGSYPDPQMKSPELQLQTYDHPDAVFADSPSTNNPPFERNLSLDKTQTLPLHRKNLFKRSHDESDNEDKLKQPLSPTSQQKRWKSAEVLKIHSTKSDPPQKTTGLSRVKSTSIKLLSKFQPKSKKPKSPSPTKDDEKLSPDPDDKTGHRTPREYPHLEKYPGSTGREPSSPTTPNSEKLEAAAAAADPTVPSVTIPLKIPLPLEKDDEPVKERVYLSSWDPTPLLKELYEIRLMDDNTEDLSHKFIEMEGLMEKLPMNKKKATLLKTWKRRYFKARNGWLIYYDNRNDERPSDEVLLMGGQVHAIGNQVIGIDDGRGRYLMVRCPSQKEYEQWLISLESQTTDNTRATYVRPSMNALKHPSKKVVMIEFGSMSIRAGILKEQATVPQLFFPNIVAVSNKNNPTKYVIGFDAYKPEVRHSSHLVQPLGPTDKIDKFKVDFETLPSVFAAIFQDLKIAPAEYYVMLILPMNIRDEDKAILMNILTDQFKVRGVCMAPQALLALYSYNAQSGIIVDIGERLEVLPIYEGFVIDGGHTVQSFGAPKIRQSLRSGLTTENYPLYSPLEQLLVRLVMEDTCFVSKDFKEECQQFQKNPEKYRETLYLKKYNLPEETYTAISHSLSRFVSPEGLFNTDLWGMDYPTIQSLVKNAIEACPMDNRRHLCRSIYLSGGVTLLPGFAQRLEAELRKQLNETLVIQVHASPQRYHSAYIGACALSSLPEFENSCISSEEWKRDGTRAFQRWKMSS